MSNLTTEETPMDSHETALRIVYKMLDNNLEYEYCDCGCPQQRTPKSRKDVDIIRIQSYMRTYTDIDFLTRLTF